MKYIHHQAKGAKTRSERLWPPEKVNAILDGIRDHKSAAQIAAEIGTTRDAVIGKCWRMGLKLPCVNKYDRYVG